MRYDVQSLISIAILDSSLITIYIFAHFPFFFWFFYDHNFYRTWWVKLLWCDRDWTFNLHTDAQRYFLCYIFFFFCSFNFISFLIRAPGVSGSKFNVYFCVNVCYVRFQINNLKYYLCGDDFWLSVDLSWAELSTYTIQMKRWCKKEREISQAIVHSILSISFLVLFLLLLSCQANGHCFSSTFSLYVLVSCLAFKQKKKKKKTIFRACSKSVVSYPHRTFI